MSTTQLDDRVMTLLTEAEEWRLLGRLFECPSAEWQEDLIRLADDLHSGALRDLARTAVTEGSEGSYHSVFGPGGPAPPREASYHASVELGSLLSSLEGAYAAFAYHPAGSEPADHIAVETGFVAYLRLKEAFAVATGEVEAAGIAERVAARFISEHLAGVAHPLADLLAESGITYLASSAAMLAARVGPRPSARQLPVIQSSAASDDGGGEFACDLH